MKSDAAKKLLPASADAFQAFFETLENPAALCDAELTLLAANPAFEVLCGTRGAVGKNLATLLQGVAKAVPPDGSSSDIEVPTQGGQSVTLTLARRGELVSVVARNLSQLAAGFSLAAAGRALLEQARVEQVLLELGRSVAGTTSEEELVAAVARGVKALFPARVFCVRICDPKTGVLTGLYAEGPMKEGARNQIVLRRSAVQKTHLESQALPPDRLKIIDDELPRIFHGALRAICAPLVASGQLFGVINVEYPEGLSADLMGDDRILIQLANQVAVGVRNAKLIDELTFVRKYLEELLEHANALIVVAGKDRRIAVFNRQLSRLTGFTKDEALGKDVLSFLPESEHMRMMRVISSSLRGENVSNFETRVAKKDGSEVRVSFATSAVTTAGGEVEGVIAIGQDLTAIRELERRIIQAEKLASLGQIAASVVHEINNPMTAVSTYADALLQRVRTGHPLDPGDQEKLKKIIDSSDRILRFTRDLTSYARPAQERPERLDLHATLELAVSFCDHVLSKYGVSVARAYADLPQVSGLKANLVQVFINLITNACHAMEGGGELGLSTETAPGCVRVKVRDGGTGIDPKHLERIFEPFFTTKPEGGGTGLGLSIVQSIIESHGGRISVQSAIGVGTTFMIELPLDWKEG